MNNRWSDEEIEFLKAHVKGRKLSELAELLEKEFGKPFPKNRIQNAKVRFNLKSGLDCSFKKGHVPTTKGKKAHWGGNDGSFKKGAKPHNYKPIGSERVTKDGDVLVKVSDTYPCWIAKRKVEYKKHHGDIPKGFVVVQVDRNQHNFDKDNLMLVNRRIWALMNSKKMLSENSDITKVNINIATLTLAISDRSREV